METLTASKLAPIINGYELQTGPRTITVPNASKIASLQDVTVTGRLIPKQLTSIDHQTNDRTWRPAKPDGEYHIEANDGDLHFCLGTKASRPHIPCELQQAKAALQDFQDAVGKPISVGGFFRCLFEHPGFFGPADAHIFEIHPVRAVDLGNGLRGFDVSIPEPDAIHDWTDPAYHLNELDAAMHVKYHADTDTLVFTGMEDRDHNYVRVSGTVSNVRLRTTSSDPASFTLTSPDIPKKKRVLCLKDTRAYYQLRQLSSEAHVTLIALRNIDLPEAMRSRYVINFLAIDLEATGSRAE